MSGIGGHGQDHRGARVAENDNGYLEHLSGTVNASNAKWCGVRTLVESKQVETKRFIGAKDDVIARWVRWQERGKGVKQSPRERIEMAENKKAERKLPGNVFVLRFQLGRTVKELAAYIDETKALDMAVSLNDALKIADQDGEWTVESMELRE